MGKDPVRPDLARKLRAGSWTEEDLRQGSAEREGQRAGMGMLPETDAHAEAHDDLKQLFKVTSTRTTYTCLL